MYNKSNSSPPNSFLEDGNCGFSHICFECSSLVQRRIMVRSFGGIPNLASPSNMTAQSKLEPPTRSNAMITWYVQELLCRKPTCSRWNNVGRSGNVVGSCGHLLYFLLCVHTRWYVAFCDNWNVLIRSFTKMFLFFLYLFILFFCYLDRTSKWASSESTTRLRYFVAPKKMEKILSAVWWLPHRENIVSTTVRTANWKFYCFID